MQISFLIGKTVLSVKGEELGYVVRVLLNKNRTKLTTLVCVDANEEEFFLPARTLHIEGDSIVCNARENGDLLGQPCPVGMRVFSETGSDMGAVRDMIFENNSAFLLLTGDPEPYSVSLARFGEVVILRSRDKPQKKSGDKKSPDEAKIVQRQEQTKKPLSSSNSSDRINLLGKIVKKTVYAQNGLPIALAGERITPDILSLARRENKLLQLTVNTLTNIDVVIAI